MLFGIALAFPAFAQMSPEEHASHHPNGVDGPIPAGDGESDGAGPAPIVTPGSPNPMGADAGGKMAGGGMGDMMKNMDASPPLELYPKLMHLPTVSPDQRQEILSQAAERMQSGVALLSKGLDRLGAAAENEDYAAIQEATAMMHQALGEFESGVAAQRALAEGQPPQLVALRWFKNEMNLQPPQGVEVRGGVLGTSPFHLFSMVLLIGFALAMIGLYFAKMRRAAELFGRIEANKGRPPPGAAPALAGKPARNVKEGSG